MFQASSDTNPVGGSVRSVVEFGGWCYLHLHFPQDGKLARRYTLEGVLRSGRKDTYFGTPIVQAARADHTTAAVTAGAAQHQFFRPRGSPARKRVRARWAAFLPAFSIIWISPI